MTQYCLTSHRYHNSTQIPCDSTVPGTVAGAQDTEVTPTGCAWGIFWTSHPPPSARWLKIEIAPSEAPQAKMRPYSWGAQLMLFTDPSCSANTWAWTNPEQESENNPESKDMLRKYLALDVDIPQSNSQKIGERGSTCSANTRCLRSSACTRRLLYIAEA